MLDKYNTELKTLMNGEEVYTTHFQWDANPYRLPQGVSPSLAVRAGYDGANPELDALLAGTQALLYAYGFLESPYTATPASIEAFGADMDKVRDVFTQSQLESLLLRKGVLTSLRESKDRNEKLALILKAIAV